MSWKPRAKSLHLAGTFADVGSRSLDHCTWGKVGKPPQLSVRLSFSLELMLPVTLDPIAKMRLRSFFSVPRSSALPVSIQSLQTQGPSAFRELIREVSAGVDVSTYASAGRVRLVDDSIPTQPNFKHHNLQRGHPRHSRRPSQLVWSRSLSSVNL